MSERQLTFLSLFAGIGGFDLGFERAGMKCVGQVEIDPFCQKVLAKHWPNVWRHDDIKTLTKELCDEHCGRIDVICGGFPCQDISLAGNRAGIDAPRSGLWAEFARLIRMVRPRFAVIENVAALLIPDKSGIAPISRVLCDLSACGRDSEWDCFPACSAGAPHERDRVFIISYPKEERFSETRDVRCDKSAQRILGEREDVHGSNDRKIRTSRFFKKKISRFAEFSWCENVRGPEDLRGRCGIPEPLFRGSRDGIPDWVDRIGSLGNAVVPQIAEYIGRLIVEADNAGLDKVHETKPMSNLRTSHE